MIKEQTLILRNLLELYLYLYSTGKVGDWKNHFTVAQNEAMDALIEEKLHGTGLRFD